MPNPAVSGGEVMAYPRPAHMTRVAFLGLGAIGAPMARHLPGRYDLAVWNRTASRAVAFASTHHGATQARTRCSSSCETCTTTLSGSYGAKIVLPGTGVVLNNRAEGFGVSGSGGLAGSSTVSMM